MQQAIPQSRGAQGIRRHCLGAATRPSPTWALAARPPHPGGSLGPLTSSADQYG